MIKEVYQSKLGYKFLSIALASLVLAFAVYMLFSEGIFWYLIHSKGFEAFSAMEEESAMESFQQYVADNHLTVAQTVSDISWSDEYGSANVTSVDSKEKELLQFLRKREGSMGTMVECSDGYVYAFTTISTKHYENMAARLSFLLAAAAFCLLFLPYTFHTIHRITHLSQEMEILTGGDLGYKVEVAGTDEISELGQSIEEMRQSVLEQMERENQAVLSNSKLITSLSHDLRTPLTKLTGYLEIMKYKKEVTQEEKDRYLDSAIEKAQEMKILSDEMFRHFQIQNNSVQEEGFETVSGNLLISQLMEEIIFDLHHQGFETKVTELWENYSLRIRVFDLKRIFDNLYSNIKKYALKDQPVIFDFSLHDNIFTFVQSNHVLKNADCESKGIGIPTMEMLTKKNGGWLSYEKGEEIFSISFSFPAIEDKNK